MTDLSFSVPEGSLFGFLGPNGAGKTTAIRVMLGFLRPTSGVARINGLDCWRSSSRVKADVGYVPGDLRLYPWFTGERALRFVGAVRRMDLSRAGRDLAERFELDMRVPVRRMSRGMRQKLGLIMALAPHPRLLVLDEPSSGLDPLMQERLREHLRNVVRSGSTVFFSSHTLGEVEQLCDHIAIVRDGQLVACAPLEEIRRKAGREVTIRWKPGATPPTPLPSLHVFERHDGEWVASYDGAIDDLLTWLRAAPIDDLTIAPPTLEALFQRYYTSEEKRA
ncbi:MAG: ABC transporter ATP-binding protein [Phycisphaerae bacterium]|nr:ABC transporter ATP-binding protein [Phycisphaerae bacterium]